MKKETQSQKKFCQKTKITKFDVHSLTFDADVLCNEMKLKDRWNTKRDECLFAQKKRQKKTVYSFYLTFLEMLLIFILFSTASSSNCSSSIRATMTSVKLCGDIWNASTLKLLRLWSCEMIMQVRRNSSTEELGGKI